MSDINSPATPAAQDSRTSARLEAGQTAPDFTLPSDNGDSIALSALRGQNIILYFYPAAMTPGCTTEACDFRDNLERLRSRGFTVLGISKDPLDKLIRFRGRDHLTFPLLSDADLTVHRLYGAYGEKKLYGKVYEGVIRSTFVIDGDGVIRVARIHPRYSNHERFLEILVQAGSHGGAHRVAKAAELVYCDVFDRDAQHVGKDKTHHLDVHCPHLTYAWQIHGLVRRLLAYIWQASLPKQ